MVYYDNNGHWSVNDKWGSKVVPRPVNGLFSDFQRSTSCPRFRVGPMSQGPFFRFRAFFYL